VRDMAMNTGFQHQQPFARTAAVRSLPSQRPGARLDLADSAKPPVTLEEKTFRSSLER